ncbi:hypothetical protein [uncultured Hyphomicrobium sp.]|uniref:hypothetical protein n=1 Tax=uncultured Hyphomicrobium sp. TaxID=194373 RepID=UPI0025DF4F95|nr:hypothetical protein [uncultured Hyphomicrobium sp.]
MDDVKPRRRGKQQTHRSGLCELGIAHENADDVRTFHLASIRRAEATLALGTVFFLVLDGRGMMPVHAMAVRHIGVARDMRDCGRNLSRRGCKGHGRHRRNAERYEHCQDTPRILSHSPYHDAR